MANLPPEVRHAFEHLKNETPLNMNRTESSYVFYYQGIPTQQQRRDHIPVPHWREPLLGSRCCERDYVYVKHGRVQYKRPIGHQCGRRTVIGTMICWQHLLYRHNLFIGDSLLTHNVDGVQKSIGKGLFTAYVPDEPNDIIYKKGDKILFYYGEKLSEREYQQRYGAFTAPYAIGSHIRPDAPVVDAALFRTISALANHKPPSQCNAVFEAAYPTNERTGRFNYAIVAKKDIRSGQEIYVDYGGAYKMHGAGSANHTTQPKRKKEPAWYS